VPYRPFVYNATTHSRSLEETPAGFGPVALRFATVPRAEARAPSTRDRKHFSNDKQEEPMGRCSSADLTVDSPTQRGCAIAWGSGLALIERALATRRFAAGAKATT
jgi:hypothetical protein